MPEGPQVYQMAAQLRTALGSNAILESLVIHPGSSSEETESQGEETSSESFPSSSSEQRFEDLHVAVHRVVSKGKKIAILLDNDQGLLIKFALGGSLEYGPGPGLATMFFSSPNGEIVVTLRDPQRLASITIHSSHKLMLPHGFDPLHTIMGMREWLTLCMAHPQQLVAKFLTDQSIIAGIGNRYRSEIMHIAKILPDAKVHSLPIEQLQILLVTIYRVLKLASRDAYEFSVFGRTESFPDKLPVTKAEVAKGVFVWTTAAPRQGHKKSAVYFKTGRKSENKAGTEGSTSVRKNARHDRIPHR